jgi:hypothetical protein
MVRLIADESADVITAHGDASLFRLTTKCLLLRHPLLVASRHSRWLLQGKAVEKTCERSLKGSELLSYRAPHDVTIDSEVGVHENMPHAGDFLPFDVRGFLTDFGWQRASGFAENLQMAHDSALNQLVAIECVPAA